jgi:hypothetical protein
VNNQKDVLLGGIDILDFGVVVGADGKVGGYPSVPGGAEPGFEGDELVGLSLEVVVDSSIDSHLAVTVDLVKVVVHSVDVLVDPRLLDVFRAFVQYGLRLKILVYQDVYLFFFPQLGKLPYFDVGSVIVDQFQLL